MSQFLKQNNVITKITKIKNGMYMINDVVIVSHIDFYNNQVQYNIDFDHTLIDNKNAKLLADSFIRDAIMQSTETT